MISTKRQCSGKKSRPFPVTVQLHESNISPDFTKFIVPARFPPIPSMKSLSTATKTPDAVSHLLFHRPSKIRKTRKNQQAQSPRFVRDFSLSLTTTTKNGLPSRLFSSYKMQLCRRTRCASSHVFLFQIGKRRILRVRR